MIKMQHQMTSLDYFNRGEVFESQGKIAEAISDYNKAIQIIDNFEIGMEYKAYLGALLERKYLS